MTTKHLPQLETLFKDAFERFKSRFLSWFLVTAGSFGLGILVFIGIGLLVALHFGIYFATQSVEITTTSAVLTGIAGLVGLIFVFSWMTLAIYEVIITDHPAGVITIFQRVRPYVWGFIWYAIISGLFVGGIVLLGMIGFVIGALILNILWGVWNAFSVFIYLEHRYKGLANLWASYHTVNQQFWGVFGRILLLFVVFYFLLFTLAFAAAGANEAALNGLIQIVNILATPFIIAYIFEIYRHLRHDEPNTKPVTGWIVASVAGWVLPFAVLILGGAALMQYAPDLEEFIETQPELIEQWEEEGLEFDEETAEI